MKQLLFLPSFHGQNEPRCACRMVFSILVALVRPWRGSLVPSKPFCLKQRRPLQPIWPMGMLPERKASCVLKTAALCHSDVWGIIGDFAAITLWGTSRRHKLCKICFIEKIYIYLNHVQISAYSKLVLPSEPCSKSCNVYIFFKFRNKKKSGLLHAFGGNKSVTLVY